MREMKMKNGWRVREERIDGLKVVFAKLAKRAAKLGVEAPRLVEVEREDTRDDGTWVTFEVEGRRIEIGGWTFGAAVSHDHDAEENIFRTDRDDVPEVFRKAGPNCDHCGLYRRRNETFLVVNEAGDWKQVGRSCLLDYTGVSPEAMLARYALVADAVGAMDDAEGEGFGFGGAALPPIDHFLDCSLALIEAYGYVSRRAVEESYENKTRTSVFAWEMSRGKGKDWPAVTDAHKAKVTKALDWARDLPEDSEGFLGNVRAAGRRSVVTFENAGLTVALLVAYDKELAKEVERKRFATLPPSAHVGTVKQRLRGLRVALQRKYHLDGMWGTTTFYTFVDMATGSVFLWKASGCPLDGDPGDDFELTGTVKKHDEYKGTKQTVLARCVATKIEAAAAA